MPKLDPTPDIIKAIGQIILSINGNPTFRQYFLDDWQLALADLPMDYEVRQALIENMERSGLSTSELLEAIQMPDTKAGRITDAEVYRVLGDFISDRKDEQQNDKSESGES